MKYILNQICIASLGILFATATCNNTTPAETESNEVSEIVVEPTPVVANPAIDTKIDTVLISTTMGDIKVMLYNETPLHKANFLKLVRSKYYEGVLFHRVIKDFMIQTGDPDSKNATPNGQYGSGGPGYQIPAEILPKYTHKKGALAAARTPNPEKASSGSQFYICHIPTPFLDGEYTVFGETVEGLEVVDKIARTPTGPNDRPQTDIKIISASVIGDAKPAGKAPVKKDSSKSKSKTGKTVKKKATK